MYILLSSTAPVKVDMFAVFDMLIDAFSVFLDKVVEPLFYTYSIDTISAGLLFMVLGYRFLLSPWLSRVGLADNGSNTVEYKEVESYNNSDFYSGSDAPRIETRGFTLK